jgi:hypothetical protein
MLQVAPNVCWKSSVNIKCFVFKRAIIKDDFHGSYFI